MSAQLQLFLVITTAVIAIIIIHLFLYARRIRKIEQVQRQLVELKAMLPESEGYEAVASGLRAHYKAISEMSFPDSEVNLSDKSWVRVFADQNSLSTVGGLILVEMEKLKYINNTYGYPFGDQVLVGISERLEKFAAEEDLNLTWLENDRIVALTSEKISRERAESLVVRLRAVYKVPLLIQNCLMRISVSCGIALAEPEASSVDMLFRNAYLALNKAMKLGRGKHLFYENAMMTEIAQMQLLEDEIQAALEKGEFCVYYQPKFDMNTQSICGLEALARWNDPEKGLRYPGEFIPIAEETGQILYIGETVLREACALEMRLIREFGREVPISVNVSSHQLAQEDFVDFVRNVISEHDLELGDLSIEITESMLMNNFIDSIDKIRRLKELGIQIHLDDFGTGYSSLNYIKNLPVDVVKIDKAFISDLGKPQADYLIEFIISLVHKLGKGIVAEGVENQVQWEQLRGYGCDTAQGFYMGKPVPEEVILSLLRTSMKHEGTLGKICAVE